ncbi:MAG: NAD+ synthase [Thermoplasmata archaeon]|nr:NAD+ synthase [Thermoplasmata archaeon]
MTEEIGYKLKQVEQTIQDTLRTTGSKGIVVGMSGGIDSSVVAALCCRAIGPEQVLGLSLPSHVNNAQDIQDVTELCANLGMKHRTIGIEPILWAFKEMPGFTVSHYLIGNLMARIRMAVLYYHANREHRLVCGTSNRSEYLLGYCTKFGDNAADIEPILHLYKTDVYVLAQELGIPEAIIKKVPSAGLWKGQSDEGEIGFTYDEIDSTLKNLEANNWNAKTTTEEKILAFVKKNAHKRMVAPNLLTQDTLSSKS